MISNVDTNMKTQLDTPYMITGISQTLIAPKTLKSQISSFKKEKITTQTIIMYCPSVGPIAPPTCILKAPPLCSTSCTK